MENFLNAIFTSWSEDALIVWGIIRILSSYKEAIILWFKKIYSNKSLMNIELLDHDFFSQLSDWIKYRIDNIVFHDTNTVRNQIVKDFVKIKFQEYQSFFKDFVSRKDLKSMSVAKIHRELKEWIIDTRKKYDERAEKEGIPKIFIQKYNNHRKVTAEEFFSRLERVTKSAIYPSSKLTLVRILDKLQDAFEDVLTDAEHTIANINGDLTELSYKWQVIWSWEKKNYLY